MSVEELGRAVLFGVVQGITEYLPISSTAHIRLVSAFLGWKDPGAAFTAVIQLGTLAAVLVYFWSDLRQLCRRAATQVLVEKRSGPDARMVGAVLAGTIPIGVFGLVFKDAIETTLRGVPVIAMALIIVGGLLGLAEILGKRNRVFMQLGFWEIQFVGLAQASALIPGVSRSGITLAAALFLGLKRNHAARFSFLLGIPAITAAGLYEFYADFHGAGLGGGEWATLGLATLVSFLSGYLAISFLLYFLRRHSTFTFVAYRVVLGFLLFGLLHSGMISK
ncbi:MAG: undecaprenyl-diphosphatase UppP [Candidatus Hydrogenedentota bacterium]|nr:MAG: undecaprenyl-diphosphatase UppP [Candidatus Hydrogenedentota bacterium]